jgi:hypothetical protein
MVANVDGNVKRANPHGSEETGLSSRRIRDNRL